MTPPIDQMSFAADVRQIRDAVTQLQISVSKIDDLVTRLDRVELQQKEAATERSKILNGQSNSQRLERYFPWIIAFLASGGMLTDGVVSAVSATPPAADMSVLDPIED